MLIFLLSITAVKAQPNNQVTKLRLNNGKYMQIQVCSDDIFRLRIQSDTAFKPSLMEDYGIIKTTWQPAQSHTIKANGNHIIQTVNFQFIVDNNAGLITVKDAADKIIIERISVTDTSNTTTEAIAKSLNDYFGPSKSGLVCKFKLGLFENPYNGSEKAVIVSHDVKSKEIALEAAKESIILLKNERNILPLNSAIYKNIAVIGPNAKDIILGDYSTLKPKYFVSVYDGIKARAGKDYNVLYSEGCKITPILPEYAKQLKQDKIKIEVAVAIAKKADIIFLVVGGNIETDREGRDRSDLQMLGYQKELITRISKLGKPIVLCLFGGKLYAMPEIFDTVAATFLCWNLGQETGTALASAIFGDHNPSGKLTVRITISTGHLPNYYNKKPTAYGRSLLL